jgi:hypothetical protein
MEDRGPLMHAHVRMMLALRGAAPIPEYNPSKEKHWGRAKAEAGRMTTRHWTADVSHSPLVAGAVAGHGCLECWERHECRPRTKVSARWRP